MLASESGEIDRARFRLNLGVTRGLENRDTAGKERLCQTRPVGCSLPAGKLEVLRTAALTTAAGVQDPGAAQGPAAL